MYDDIPDGLKDRILSGAGEVARRYARPAPPSQRMLTAKVKRVGESGTLDLDYEGAELAGVPMTESCRAAKAGDSVLVESYEAELVATGIMSDGSSGPPPDVMTKSVTVFTTPDGNAGVGILASDAAIVSATTASQPGGVAIACAPYIYDASRGELGVHCSRVDGKSEPVGGQSIAVTIRYVRLR